MPASQTVPHHQIQRSFQGLGSEPDSMIRQGVLLGGPGCSLDAHEGVPLRELPKGPGSVAIWS